MAEKTVAELILKILAESDEFKKTLKDAKKENAEFTEKLAEDSEGATKKMVSAFKKVIKVVEKVHETLKLTAKTLYNISFKIFAKAVAPIAIFVAAMASVKDESFRVATMFRSVARSMKIFAREAADEAIPVAEWLAEKLATLAYWTQVNAKNFRGFVKIILYVRTAFLGLIGTLTFLGGVFFTVFAWLFKRAIVILILWVAKLMLLKFFGIGLWTALRIAVVLLIKAFWRLAIFALKPLIFILTKLVALVWALLTPIGLIIAAVILLGIAWYKNWFGMRDIVRNIAEFVGKAMGNLMDTIGLLIILFGQLWLKVWEANREVFKIVVESIGWIIGTAFKVAGKALGFFSDLWRKRWNSMFKVVETVMGWIGKVVNKVTEFFYRMFEFKKLRDEGRKMGDAWREAGENAKKAMKDLALSGKDTETQLKNLATKATGFVKTFTDKIADAGLITGKFLEKGGDKIKDISKELVGIGDAVAAQIKTTAKKLGESLVGLGGDWDKKFVEFMKNAEEFADTLGPRLNALFDKLFAPKPEIPQWISDFVKGWQDGIERATKGWDQFGSHIMNVAESTATGMKDTFADVFVDGFNGQLKTASEYFLAFRNVVLKAIAEMIAKMITFSILRNTAGSFAPFSQFFGGAAKHLGGMIRKAHEGLALDEVPIVAQTGEAVLSRQGVAGLGGPPAVEALNAGGALGGGAVTKNITINAMDAESFNEFAKKNKGSIGEAVMDDADENSPVRRLT